jgi:histidine ammonia-lyase
METIQIGSARLDAAQLVSLAKRNDIRFELCSKARTHMSAYRELVEDAIRSGKTIYGINTGFGLLSDVGIAPADLANLQINLIRSHAIGVGEILDPLLVRVLVLLKAHSLTFGHSGIRPLLVERLLSLLNEDMLPVIPKQGSVGASGDLAPLAHMSLALLGEGDVLYKGRRLKAKEALKDLGWEPIELGAKEGLSLINGTQFMTALGAVAIEQAKTLVESADVAVALSLDAFRGTMRAFDERIHTARNQEGQKVSASRIRSYFETPGEIQSSHSACGKVQDPYSFRCAAQVHGASLDAIQFVTTIIDREINAVTDNPLVFDDGEVLSGGNFHGQPVAMALDFLCIAVSELGSISERRIEKLTNPVMSGLPAFLVKNSGLNSGYMIHHVTAAALVSENKIYCHPAVVDSIPTSADKEDHVSMGPISARKALHVCQNVSHILALEMAAAAQGIDLLAPLKPGPILSKVYKRVREIVPYMENDRYLAEEIAKLSDWLMQGGACTAIAES